MEILGAIYYNRVYKGRVFQFLTRKRRFLRRIPRRFKFWRVVLPMKRISWLNRRNSILILITYVVAFLVPLCALFIYLFPQTEVLLTERLESSLDVETSMTTANFESEINALYNYAFSLSNSERLTTDVLRDDTPINRSIISQELGKAVSHDTYVSLFLLYSPRFDRYYSSDASYRGEWVNSEDSSVFAYADLGHEEFARILRKTQDFTILPQRDVRTLRSEQTCVTVIAPVTEGELQLIALIPSEEICGDSVSARGSTLLVDADDKVLAGDLFIDGQRVRDLAAFNCPREDGLYSAELGGDAYYLYTSSLQYGDMRIASFFSYDTLSQDIDALHSNTLILMLLLFLAGAILVFLGMRVTYVPLKRVLKTALRLAPVQQIAAGGVYNDWDVVSYTLKHLSEQTDDARKRLFEMRRLSKEMFLYRYLFGGMRDEADIIEMAEIYGIDIRDQMLCVAFAEVGGEKKAQAALENVFRDIEPRAGRNARVSWYFIIGTPPADLFLVLFFNGREDLEPYLERLFNLKAGVKAGIGTCEPLPDPDRSRAMSLYALETALLDKEHSAVRVEDALRHHPQNIGKLFDQIELYEMAICRRDTAQMEAVFRPLVEMLFGETKRLYVVQIAYISLYTILAQQLSDRNHRYETISSPYDTSDKPSEMRATLETMHAELMASMEGELGSEARMDDIRQVLAFLDENYSDANLSLLSVAERFGYSYSNFSHFFRKKTSQTFSGYLERIRINKAKRLLDESDDVLNVIATKVGFTNVNTFTRSFKKLELITPGAYRARQSADGRGEAEPKA